MLDTQDKLYAADPSVIDGTSARGLAQTMRIAICNSKGLDVSYESSVAGLIAMPTVSDGTEMENDFSAKLGKLDTIDAKALADKAVAVQRQSGRRSTHHPGLPGGF